MKRGGDCLLALKENRPITFADVAAFFANPPPGALDTHQTADGDHPGIEVRRHAVYHDVTWLFSDRRYPDEPTFPGLAMIGLVYSYTERNGKTAQDRRYHPSSRKLGAKTFARAEPCTHRHSMPRGSKIATAADLWANPLGRTAICPDLAASFLL